MRICLIIHSLGIGGMERVMTQLANNFAGDRNCTVHIILIGRSRKISYNLSDSIEIHKPVFTFNNSRRNLDIIRTIYFLREKVKDIAPDTILSFGEMWNNLVLLALKGFNIPIYISDRSEPGKDLGRTQNFLRDMLYPRASGYIAQTQKAKEVCLDNGWNTNVKVIGNPIRQVQLNNDTERENIVLSVGRLIPSKHFDQLIEIFAEIADTNWKLLIVGGNAKKMDLSAKLNTLIKKLGVEKNVFLEGEQKNIDSYYRRSKIFAFTSSSEGFPNVIGEALSARLPVVAYDCIAGPSEMIQDGDNGFLVPLFDQEKFKDRLQLLMADKDIRKNFSEQSCRYINKLNINEISDQYRSFLFDQKPLMMV